MEKQNEIIIYKTEDGLTKIDVTIGKESVWLTQNQMAELFQTTKQNISLHISNIFKDGELEVNSVVKDFFTTASDGKKYKTKYYNLDVIISVGYRVKSLRGTQFRMWANQVLKEYLIKGFALNDEKLENANNSVYFRELLNRIRKIRASEKMFYLQLLEIFATSVDYNPNSIIAHNFFAQIQNKLHWAIHGHTAAEIIYERANAELPFMGLTNFKGSKPTKDETHIAKNYLNEKEIALLDRLVSAYLDLAEFKAIKEEQMTMKNWIDQLDDFLKMSKLEILQNSGKISSIEAKNKANLEYEKYQNKSQDTLTQSERDLIAYLKKSKE